MDGLALCRAVREDPELAHLPILLVTGEFSAREVDERTGEFGPVDAMVKPFNADQLGAKVKRMLGEAQLLPEAPQASDASS